MLQQCYSDYEHPSFGALENNIEGLITADHGLIEVATMEVCKVVKDFLKQPLRCRVHHFARNCPWKWACPTV